MPVVIAMGMVLVSRRAEPLGPGAEQAIDQAVQQLRDEALLTPATDWEALRQAAHRRLREAPSAARLDAELAGLVQALGDPHTSYQPPATARQIMAGGSSAAPVPDSAPVSAGQHGPWPVLALDAFGPIDTERSRKAALAIRVKVTEAMARSPCGLMLDLRANRGGNMYPMLMGAAPLLEPSPQQALLGFRSRRGPDQSITLEDVSALMGLSLIHI